MHYRAAKDVALNYKELTDSVRWFMIALTPRGND